MRHLSPILPSVLPAAVIGIGFLVLLGFRPDYLGHFAAGYGGTLTALALLTAAIPRNHFASRMPITVVATVVICICGGIFTEATLFNIAKFDEVDFCNQSLGAFIAGLGILANLKDDKADEYRFRLVTYAGLIALHIGFYFAMF